jgi:hypothetical protein
VSERRADALATAAVVAIAAAIVLSSHVLGDYASSSTADNAAPAIRDLLAGDLHRFLADQPLMGSLSLLLRLPFAGLAKLLGGGATLTYQLGALPCVSAPGLVGVVVARRMRAAGRPAPVRALIIAVCLLNPATFGALRAGHPEELLAASFCAAAVLLARSGERPVLAGLLAGMAFATKQWALLALAPVLLVAPAARLRVAAAAMLAGALLTLPAPLASPAPFLKAGRAVAGSHRLYPTSAWWALRSSQRVVASDGVAEHRATVQRLPLGLTRSAGSGALVLAAVALIAACLARRRRLELDGALGLLALLMLLRCVLDPLPLDYYYAPVLVALAAWEGQGRRSLPIGTLLAGAAVAALLGPAPLGLGATATNVLVLTMAAVLAWRVGRATFGGERRPSTEVTAPARPIAVR